MHRSEAEGRFGEADPEGRASVCARATQIGVYNNRANSPPLSRPALPTCLFSIHYGIIHTSLILKWTLDYGKGH